MRRRAQKKSVFIPEIKKIKKITKKKIPVLIPIALVSIFFLVLFFNTYFNVTEEVGINPNEHTEFNKKFLLSGPDPYYNMRSIQQTLEKGYYPWGETDYLMNYPLGSSGAARPPLMNMLALAFSQPLSLFMSQDDAIGYSMQFLPALFGALLIFPVYFIGKALFNKKVGLLAAFLVPLVPIHIASGHGSSYTLFDHDSFNLLLSAFIWLFFIMGLKSESKKKALFYGALTGVSLGCLSMAWISAQFIFIILATIFVVLVFIDILRSRMNYSLFITTFTSLFVAYLLYLPLSFTRITELTLVVIVAAISLTCIVLKKLKIPYIISLPAFGIFGIAGLYSLYHFRDFFASSNNIIFSGLAYMSDVLFGTGVYGTKVDLTIAEARAFEMGRTVMSFGPALYWLAIAGFLLLCAFWWKDKKRSDLLFFAILFIIQFQILGTAGRFLNDTVPLMVVLGAFFLCYVFKRLELKKAIRRVKDIGGLKGLKSFGLVRIAVIFIVVLVVFIPNTYMSLEAGIPATEHQKYFGGDSQPFFGLHLYKEIYWIEAFHWLSQQDMDITNPTERPAFISWWDYGFYGVAVGEHPVVADNFQEGIPTAANFHTAQTEQEAICVLAIRLLEGDMKKNNGRLSAEAKHLILQYFPPEPFDWFEYNSDQIIEEFNETVAPGHFFISYMESPETCPSFNKLIGEEYGNTVLRVTAENAKYRDCVKILLDNLPNDEQVTQFYLDIENVTGFSIRYYGTEGYDINIFPVFAFLSDKGVHGFVTMEDDYQITVYKDKDGQQWKYEELLEMDMAVREQLAPFSPSTEWKDAFYETMVYRTYKDFGWGLSHFAVAYTSPYGYPGTQQPAVVISKYYPGCYISGDVTYEGTAMSNLMLAVIDGYRILHGTATTNQEGFYDILSTPGENTLAAIMGTEIIAEFRINVTEDEANRVTDYRKSMDLELEPASLAGSIADFSEGDYLFIKSESYGLEGFTVIPDVNGTFSVNKTIPGIYSAFVYNDTGEKYNQTFTLKSGENTLDLDGIG